MKKICLSVVLVILLPAAVFSFDFSFGLKYSFIIQNDVNYQDEISNYPDDDIIIDETFDLTMGYFGPYITFIFGDRINLYLSGNLGFGLHGSISGSDLSPDFSGVLNDSELGILYRKKLPSEWEMLAGPAIHYGWANIDDESIGNLFGAGAICMVSKRKSENFAFSFTGSLFYNFLNEAIPDISLIQDIGNGFSLSLSTGMTF